VKLQWQKNREEQSAYQRTSQEGQKAFVPLKKKNIEEDDGNRERDEGNLLRSERERTNLG